MPGRIHSETICVIDDNSELRELLCSQLRQLGYQVSAFSSGEDFLHSFRADKDSCDLIITDVTMPGLSGYDLCRIVRTEKSEERIPVIMITGSEPSTERARGLEAGADEFIQKPFRLRELQARIHTLLEIRAQEIVRLSELNAIREQHRVLGERLERESNRSNRLGKLSRFVSPQVAQLLKTGNEEQVLNPHRAEVTVMFVDLRNFTSFSEFSDPTEVMDVLSKYYAAVGGIALEHKATLGHLAGDGVMVFINDPEPIEHHQEAAGRMALDVRDALGLQRESWRKSGYDIDYGIGLAEGPATIGGIGFERFWQYSVIGPVTNFASRLCQSANRGQILVSHRFLSLLGEQSFCSELIGRMTFKGIRDSVQVHNILSLSNT